MGHGGYYGGLQTNNRPVTVVTKYKQESCAIAKMTARCGHMEPHFEGEGEVVGGQRWYR